MGSRVRLSSRSTDGWQSTEYPRRVSSPLERFMPLGKQESYYLDQEADDYFNRNREKEQDPPDYVLRRIDRMLRLLDGNGVHPARVLELGAAGGLFLSRLQKEYGAECLGIEPSLEAVQFAKEKHDEIDMRQGVASDLPADKTSYFDLVVLKGVLCWIGREELLRSVAEVDRVLADGGHLLIADYLPEYPTKNRNSHVDEEDIYCYKIDHSKIFLDTHIYTVIGGETYFDQGETFEGRFDDTRNYTSLLRKSYGDFYLPGEV